MVHLRAIILCIFNNSLLFERIDNIILKCYHLNIKGVLPVAMIPRNNLRYKNTANLPGLAAFLCAVFSECISQSEAGQA